MSEFLPGVGPVFAKQAEVQFPPIAEAAVPAKPLPPMTPEQVRAVDAALARDDESATVASLLGLWTGSMLLHDLAEEHFHLPADEDEDEKKRQELPSPPE
jgi:hypothetical protein